MMKEVLKIEVTITNSFSVVGGSEEVKLLNFTAKASGLFSGETAFVGTDTQWISKERTFLSARYLLTGKDFTGKECSLFVQNEGNAKEGFFPKLVTDSENLRFLEKAKLTSALVNEDGKLFVKIFAKGFEE